MTKDRLIRRLRLGAVRGALAVLFAGLAASPALAANKFSVVAPLAGLTSTSSSSSTSSTVSVADSTSSTARYTMPALSQP